MAPIKTALQPQWSPAPHAHRWNNKLVAENGNAKWRGFISRFVPQNIVRGSKCLCRNKHPSYGDVDGKNKVLGLRKRGGENQRDVNTNVRKGCSKFVWARWGIGPTLGLAMGLCDVMYTPDCAVRGHSLYCWQMSLYLFRLLKFLEEPAPRGSVLRSV